mgnify:CR=1 FL=1
MFLCLPLAIYLSLIIRAYLYTHLTCFFSTYLIYMTIEKMLLLCLVQLLIFSQFASAFPATLGKYDIQAPLNADGTVRFFVVGDWGGLPTSPYDTPSEVAVAEAMGKLGTQLNTSFQLALGDNFYYDGVKSATDPRFEVIQFFL